MGRPSSTLETGVIYCGDNLDRMRALPSESVDLIYLDPPFFSSRIYEVIWGDEAEVRSFADRWEGGIQVYTNWMRDRVTEMHRLLKPDGSIYLHCDWHASHYLKVMLDGVFGAKMFRNELIWHYNTGGKGKTAFLRKHDTILWYSKSAKYQFHRDAIAVPRSVGTAHLRHGVDADGREYYEDFSARKSGKLYRWYLDEGVTPMDVWTDIQALNPMASERLGYPTQKPEALLDRIIAASSKPGDVVLDPFCGCGTTVSVAEKTGRQWVGIDISPTAVNIMDRRIKRIPGAHSPTLIGLPSTVDDLRTMKPFEFQNWVIQQFFGVSSPRKSGDMGIDGYSFLSRDPIQVKRSDKVGRNVIDNFQTAIRRDGSTTGWIVAFSFTKDAREEVARAKWQEKLDIHLVTVENMLKPKAERRGPFWPEPASVTELPLNPPRDVSKMTGEDLVKSDLHSTAV